LGPNSLLSGVGSFYTRGLDATRIAPHFKSLCHCMDSNWATFRTCTSWHPPRRLPTQSQLDHQIQKLAGTSHLTVQMDRNGADAYAGPASISGSSDRGGGATNSPVTPAVRTGLHGSRGSGSVVTRLATYADLPAVAALHIASCLDAYRPHVTPEDHRLTLPGESTTANHAATAMRASGTSLPSESPIVAPYELV
jgi:hypothetical protein